jgi:hypothetical protein
MVVIKLLLPRSHLRGQQIACKFVKRLWCKDNATKLSRRDTTYTPAVTGLVTPLLPQ